MCAVNVDIPCGPELTATVDAFCSPESTASANDYCGPELSGSANTSCGLEWGNTTDDRPFPEPVSEPVSGLAPPGDITLIQVPTFTVDAPPAPEFITTVPRKATI